MVARSRWLSFALVVALGTWRLAPESASADAPPLRYIALGDSITAANYAPDGGYASRYNGFISQDLQRPSQLENLGVGGWTSAQLLSALQLDPAYREAGASADVVSVYIGMNDFFRLGSRYVSGDCGGADGQDCVRSAIDTLRANVAAILDEVASLNSTPDLLVRVANIYYPGAGNAGSNTAVLGSFLGELNTVIRSEAGARAIVVADVHSAFNGADGAEDPAAKGFLGQDGVHPSEAGFAAIADAFRATGYTPLEDSGATGDADCNGETTAQDAALILQFSAGVVPVLECLGAADADGDNAVTPLDATLVLQRAAGLIE